MSTKADVSGKKVVEEVSQTKAPKPISYELYAPRSNEQRSRLMRIHDLTVGPTGSSHLISSEEEANDDSEFCTFEQAMSPPGEPLSGSSSIEHFSSDPLDSGHFIYSQFQDIRSVEETQILTQALSQAQNTSRHISKIIQSSTALHNALVQTTTLAKGISARHEALLQHSSELSQAAERLQSESDQLAQHAEEIGLPLKHYDAVDHLGIQVGVLFKNGTVVNGLAKIKVDDDGFVQILDDIDAAVRFFAERSEWTASHHPHQNGTSSSSSSLSSKNRGDSTASGSIEYYKRALLLQEAALDLFKEAIVVRITQTAMQISSALDLTRKSISGDTLEASLIYTRFHGISSRSRKLLQIIQARMGTISVPTKKAGEYICPYTELWNLCRNTYIQVRESLLKLSVRNHLEHLKEKHGLIGMTRLASVFLMRLCTAETSLYLDFFGKEAEVAHISDHDSNPDLSGITSDSERVKAKPKKDAAVLASQVMSKDGTYYDIEFQGLLDTLCNNLHRTIRRGMVSILDLDTLCQIVSVLREERSLANASPTTMAAARSLGRVIVDAQERLIFCANSVLGKEVTRFKATPADLDYPDKLRKFQEQNNENNGSNHKDTLQQQMKIYESWFPPIRSVLKVLSRIFRVVEPKVFEDIALSSVQSCCKNLKDGSIYIGNKSGELHSDLFLVKHLLILREQLSPFDIQLRSVERQLDFSDAGKAVSKFLATRNRHLFSMSTENALVTLLREGVHTKEASVDSKRDLEDALRSACNDFIEHTAVSLAGSIITFVEQCKSVHATKESLSSQSFMTGDYVKAVVSRTLDRLEPQLGEVKTQMELYMDSAATQSILFRPVIRKILRVLDETKRFVEECAVDDNDSWAEGDKDHVLKTIHDIELLLKS